MRCSKCGRDNLTEADFYRRSRRGRDPFKEPPLMSHCKECHKKWVLQNTAARKAAGYQPSDESLNRRRSKMREYQRRRYHEDIERSRAQGRERYRWRKKKKTMG